MLGYASNGIATRPMVFLPIQSTTIVGQDRGYQSPSESGLPSLPKREMASQQMVSDAPAVALQAAAGALNSAAMLRSLPPTPPH